MDYAIQQLRRENLKQRLIRELIIEGHHYERHITCEGTCESGPYALDYKGVRVGRIYLEEDPKGDIYIMVNIPRAYMPWMAFIDPKTELYQPLRQFIETGMTDSETMSKMVFHEKEVTLWKIS